MSNKIHPTCIIEGAVEIGEGNEIGPYSIIYGPTKIGDGNIIGPHVVIGTPGQDTREPRHDSSGAFIQIGNNNIIREFTAIQKPRYRDITRIGDDVFIMQSVHVPHDAVISDGAVITPMVAMGGVVRIMKGATLALGCSLHQFVVIGHYAFVAMEAAITRNVRPFVKYVPGGPVTVNDYAIKKHGLMDYKEEIDAYVLERVEPRTPILLELIREFELESTMSGRKTY
jgi:UDP-N-acetylglucosamine acyltransferase